MNLNNTKIAIIGLGYVGLPLAVEFGKKRALLGFSLVNWPTNTPVLVIGWASCALLYSAVYARFTQIQWCFSPATLQPQPA